MESNIKPLSPAIFLLGISVFLLFAFRGLPLPWLEDATPDDNLISSYSLPTLMFFISLILVSCTETINNLLCKKTSFIKPFHLYPLGLLLVWIFISYLATQIKGASGRSWSGFLEIEFSLILIQISYMSFNSISRLKIFYSTIFLASVFASLFHLFLQISDPNSGHMRAGSVGASGATYNTLAYSLVAGLWVGPAFSLHWKSLRNLAPKILIYSLFIITGIFLTGTKGAIVAIVALFLLNDYVILKKNNKNLLVLLNWRTIFLVFCLILSLLVMSHNDSSHRAFDFQYSHFTDRFQILTFSIEKIFENFQSIFLGQGIGLFVFVDHMTEYYYPHNVFLGIAVNAGLPAMGVFLYLVIKSFKTCMKILTNKNTERDLYDLSLQTLGFGLVGVIGGLIAFKFASNFLLLLFISVASRIDELNSTSSYSIKHSK